MRLEVPGLRSLWPFHTEALVLHLPASAPASAAKRVSEPGAAAFAYSVPLVNRFRVAVFLQRGSAAQAHQGAFAAAGFEAVTVPSYREARQERGAVVVCPDALFWTPQTARRLLAKPSALRRGCVILLLGNGWATGDGWQAFILQVDLLLSAADATRLGELLGAVLAAKGQLVGLLDEEAAAPLAG